MGLPDYLHCLLKCSGPVSLLYEIQVVIVCYQEVLLVSERPRDPTDEIHNLVAPILVLKKLFVSFSARSSMLKCLLQYSMYL